LRGNVMNQASILTAYVYIDNENYEDRELIRGKLILTMRPMHQSNNVAVKKMF